MRWIRTCWDDIEGSSSSTVVLALAKIAVSGVMVVVTRLVDNEHAPDADLDADADIEEEEEEEEEEDANKQSQSVPLLPLSSSVYISV